ncbi:MAG: B12-binding domain-containing radical SAM protein [Oscillospiraceae bacterium]|nr:B12-binding domain-containing radical SAM protein [Oscillospiraceae bacterium]
MKIRFIKPGNPPYKPCLENLFTYNKYIRTPSNGLLTLATIVKEHIPDTLMYSEGISEIVWSDVLDADIVFIGIFTFAADRGYELAEHIRKNSTAKVVMGGLHATLCTEEAAAHCDYVLTGEGDETILKLISSVENNTAPDFAGAAYMKDGKLIDHGRAPLPMDIDVIPDRNLCYNFKKMAAYNTIWPQVHASRGCPHNCGYCSLVAAFGRKVRFRSPDNVVEDIRQAIDFFDKGHHRLSRFVWITDDNFFADRKWAMEVLDKIIDSGIKYTFSVQARYEVGFDDEMLELLKKAGFEELAMGIEFLEDEAFESYNKKSTYSEILRSVKNIQKHGIRVRGLFIVGADNHTKGVGERLADFVIKNDICGVLIQSMYFIPGTPVYDTHKDKLIDKNWSRCVGKVVHYPEKISPYELQQEIIIASRRIYSVKRLIHAILHKRGVERILFMGEYFWHKSIRAQLKKELPYLKSISQ